MTIYFMFSKYKIILAWPKNLTKERNLQVEKEPQCAYLLSPPFWKGRMGVKPLTKFIKGGWGLDRISIFRQISVLCLLGSVCHLKRVLITISRSVRWMLTCITGTRIRIMQYLRIITSDFYFDFAGNLTDGLFSAKEARKEKNLPIVSSRVSSKLVHTNCKKHFKMKVLRFMLY